MRRSGRIGTRVLAILGISLMMSGCGLGDKRFEAPAGATPEQAVGLRDRELNNAILQEDIDGVMRVLSDAYRNSKGQTKVEKRQEYVAAFQLKDYLRADITSETFGPANPDNTLVSHTRTVRFVSTNRATGAQVTEDQTEVQQWAKEGNLWRLLSSDSPSDNTGGGPSIANPEERVRAENRKLIAAVSGGNVEDIMKEYSEFYLDDRGLDKTKKRAAYEALFNQYNILRVDVLQETYGAPNPDNTRITYTATKRFIMRDKQSGEEVIDNRAEIQEWGSEGGVWRIISSNNPAAGQPSANPTGEVRARDLELDAALARGDVSAIMRSYYSQYYLDDTLKANLDQERAALEDFFAKYQIIRIDNLDLPKEWTDRLSPLVPLLPYQANPDGTLVLHAFVKRVVYRDRITETQYTASVPGGFLWGNEEGTWRVIAPRHHPLFEKKSMPDFYRRWSTYPPAYAEQSRFRR